jgi:hypothetical protein
LRVKRQDPLFEANDPAERDADLGPKERIRKLSLIRTVFEEQSTAVECEIRQRSLTQDVSGGDTGSRLRYGAGRKQQSSLQFIVASGN